MMDVDNEDLVDIVGQWRVEQLRAAGAASCLAERLGTLRVVEHRAYDDGRLPGTQVDSAEPVQVIGGAGEQGLWPPVDSEML